VQGNSGSYRGGLLPFTYRVDQWNALLRARGPGSITVPAVPGLLPATTLTLFDSYKVDTTRTGTDSVSSGTDKLLETRLFPDNTTSGNYGTLNFTKSKSSNSTDVLRDLIQYGPTTSEWADLPELLEATPSNSVTINGDPGISSGMEDALRSIVGQPRVLPLFRSYTTGSGGGGNNTFYEIVDFVPVTVVAADLHGGSKYITIQPRIMSVREALGSSRLDFTVTPSGSPNLLFLGSRSLVR
jgi:hypothetical protein